MTAFSEQRARYIEQRAVRRQRRFMKKRFMDRALSVMRSALFLLGLLLAVSFRAEAQQPKRVPRIGILSPGSGSADMDAFRQGLRELGYVEGQNITLEYRWAEGNEDRLPVLAAELLHMNVDLIVATTPRGARAAQRLTSSTPIVTPVIPTAVGSGLVDSLYRPGGNVTGLSFMSPELGGKRLELLKEVVPKISRVAVLANVGNVDRERSDRHEGRGVDNPDINEIASVARSLSVQLQIVNVKTPDEIENAFSSILRVKAHALTVLTQGMFVLNRKRIVELAAKCRLPAIYHRNDFVKAGGLMSYGPNHADLYRRAAYYVDKILKGAKPGDLPVEQPTKFEFVINLKAAKEIGVTIPPDLLMWANKVIK
jgi:putative tryptophan/tyrosine transport system substrate-binding protein